MILTFGPSHSTLVALSTDSRTALFCNYLNNTPFRGERLYVGFTLLWVVSTETTTLKKNS